MKARVFLLALLLVVLLVSACGSGQQQDREPRIGDDEKKGDLWKQVEKLCVDKSNSPAIASILERGTLRTAHGLFPPFAFEDPSGEGLIGIDLDAMRDLSEVMEVELDTRVVDWGVLAAGLQSDRYEMVASGFFALPERDEVIDFSKPYQMSGQLFFAMADRDDIMEIEDINDPSMTFVYGTGSAQKALADKYLPEANIVDAPLRGQFLLYEFLKSGRADASATDSIYLPVIESVYPDLKTVPLNAEPIEPFPIAIGIKQDDVGMKVCVDAYVDWLQATDTFPERLKYWQEVSGSSGDLE